MRGRRDWRGRGLPLIGSVGARVTRKGYPRGTVVQSVRCPTMLVARMPPSVDQNAQVLCKRRVEGAGSELRQVACRSVRHLGCNGIPYAHPRVAYESELLRTER